MGARFEQPTPPRSPSTENAALIAALGLTYITLEDNTVDIERLFRRMNDMEDRFRKRRLGAAAFRACTLILAHAPYDLSALMERSPEDRKATDCGIVQWAWKPRQLLLKAQQNTLNSLEENGIKAVA